MSLRKITKRQFDSYCYSRNPFLRILSMEVSWFEAFDRKILATVILDNTDNDYGYVILGRDATKMFRCVDLGSEFYETPEEAEKALEATVLKFENDGQELYPQGDEKQVPNEILIPCVNEQQLHPYFKVLTTEPRFEAAKNLINEIVYSYIDVDGNYIKEFQTHGFDSRLWELYLYVYLYDTGALIKRDYAAPDYHISIFGEELFIEAVTVNPSQSKERPDPAPPTTNEETALLIKDYIPIKYGSTLYSKLQKKYWEKPHVAEKPFILAIHDFHMPGSMTWSRTGLCDYLYGVRTRVNKRDDGELQPVIEKIESHSWEGKTIPSNFFAQPGSENVSAVLFSNAATITKFNRMGKLAGLGSKKVKMIRYGFLYNPDPKALLPIPFSIEIDSEEYEESWSDSLTMYHNSNAKHPLDPELLPDISHIWYDDINGFTGRTTPYDVLSSITIAISSDGSKLVEEENGKL